LFQDVHQVRIFTDQEVETVVSICLVCHVEKAYFGVKDGNMEKKCALASSRMAYSNVL